MALSDLDTFAGEFAAAFARIHAAMRLGSKISTVIAFNGNNLERWLVKTLCGLLASGNGRRAGGLELPREVRDDWLAVQYGLSDFIGTAGLYVPGRIQTRIPTTSGQFAVGPLSGNDGRAVGVQATLQLFDGVLLADNFSGTPRGAIDSESVWRPSALIWTDGASEHRVELHWDRGSGDTVTMMYEREPPALPADG